MRALSRIHASGECTVALRGDGKGGRSMEFLRAPEIKIAGRSGIFALAAV